MLQLESGKIYTQAGTMPSLALADEGAARLHVLEELANLALRVGREAVLSNVSL